MGYEGFGGIKVVLGCWWVVIGIWLGKFVVNLYGNGYIMNKVFVVGNEDVVFCIFKVYVFGDSLGGI